MIDPFKIIFKWRQKNDAAIPRNNEEERLVTSRRAFLGLLGGAAAVAVTSSPVFQTLEVLANEAPALQPFDPSEGVLQMLVPDKGWVSLGSLRNIRLPPPPETRMIDFELMGGQRTFRAPAFQPNTTSFELVSNGDFGPTYSELIGWMDIVTSHRPSTRDYKRTLRCNCLGITWEVDGAFISRFDTNMNRPDDTGQFGDTSFEIEIYSDSMRVVTDTERDHAFA